MALAPPGYCYFSFPKTLIASFNEEQLLLEILVMCGQNVGAGVTIEWPPDRPILMRLADAQALLHSTGQGFIEDRERPDTIFDEARRQGRREGIAQE